MGEDTPREIQKNRKFIGSREEISSTSNRESPATSRPKKSSS